MSNLFPKSVNLLPFKLLAYAAVVGGIVTAGIAYYATPSYANVGYAPVQPVPFSHALHSGQLGIDCRYCHSNVEKSGHANIPTAQTCMGCHNQIKIDSPLLAPVRDSYASGDSIPWVKIHSAPDYVYFNHSVHIARGVSCISCHGQINKMDVVHQAESHSMSFCLDCHRAPEKFIRDPKLVTDLDWKNPQGEKAQVEQGKKFVHNWNVKPPESCSGCHR